MAGETGNTYISATITDSVEIPTANTAFSTMTSSIKEKYIQPSDCDNDEQPEMARLAAKTSILPFPVVDRCRDHLTTPSSSSPWSKMPE